MHEHPVQVYYEDTDHSGVVYHANYLKYFERAREHLLGVDELRRLYNEEGIGFVVYKATLTYKEGAVFADSLVVRTAVNAESPYRAVFDQRVYRVADNKLLVQGEVELVCVDRNNKLTKLPTSVEGLAGKPPA